MLFHPKVANQKKEISGCYILQIKHAISINVYLCNSLESVEIIFDLFIMAFTLTRSQPRC